MLLNPPKQKYSGAPNQEKIKILTIFFVSSDSITTRIPENKKKLHYAKHWWMKENFINFYKTISSLFHPHIPL